MTGKAGGMPPVGQMAPDKRACVYRFTLTCLISRLTGHLKRNISGYEILGNLVSISIPESSAQKFGFTFAYLAVVCIDR